MKKFLPLYLTLFATLLFCGCSSVVSKKPVGDKIPSLSFETWSGRWVAGDGGAISTRIRNARLGIVEIYDSFDPMNQEQQPQSQRRNGRRPMQFFVREAGGRTLVSVKDPAKKDGNFTFGRMVNHGDYIVVFGPNVEAFNKLIKAKIIQGTLLRDDSGKFSGSSQIEEFTEETLKKMAAAGVKLDDLFERDPAMVLVRKVGK